MANSSVIVLIFYSLPAGGMGYIFSNQSTDLKNSQKQIIPASKRINIIAIIFKCYQFNSHAATAQPSCAIKMLSTIIFRVFSFIMILKFTSCTDNAIKNIPGHTAIL